MSTLSESIFLWKKFLINPVDRRIFRQTITEEALPESALYALREKRCIELFRHAYTNIPYYRKKYSEVGIQLEDIQTYDDFGKLPVLEKQEVREHAKDMIAGTDDLSRLTQGGTGGSTGEPLLFYKSLDANMYEIGSPQRMHIPFDGNWAIVGRNPPSPRKKRLDQIFFFPSKRIYLNAAKMSSADMKDFAEKLFRLSKVTIRGYVGGICEFAGISVLNTRVLSPVEYGDVKYIINTITFLSGFLLLGYFVSGCRLIALSRDDEYIRRVKAVMIIILGITFLVMTLLTLSVAIFYWYKGNDSLARLFAVGTLISSFPLLSNYINTTAQGDNKINDIAIARLIPSIFYLIIGWTVFRLWGASCNKVLLLQYGIPVVVLLLIIFSRPICFKGLKAVFKDLQTENSQYGMQVYLGSICGVSMAQLAGITLGIFSLDNRLVGFFSLATTLSAPLLLLPSIIGTVYYKNFTREWRIPPRTLFFTLLFSLSGLLLFIICIHPVVNFLYPAPYAVVVYYAGFLGLGTVLHGLGDLFNRFLGAHGDGKGLRNGAIFCGVILVIGNLAGVYFLGISGAIITRIAASGGYLAVMIYHYLSLTQNMKKA